jgi:2-polyprenyl-3-methyl-5-hydroxy-6-metoxy-1,4-benzoquinol methylase
MATLSRTPEILRASQSRISSRNEVSKFYNEITYPLRPCSVDWANPLSLLCPTSPKRILHAGCATGSQTRSMAYVFPEAEVVGVDFSDGSLALARKWLRDPKMSKVRFEKADLTQSLDRFGEFDMVVSYGVLHHIPAVDQAVANIRRVLSSDRSPFFIFLYGKYGRARMSQLQQALAMWQAAVPGLTEQERMDALWAAAESNGTFAGVRGWLKKAMVTASSKWRKVWSSSNADAYLHPFVRYYDLADIYELCERSGLRFSGFVRRPGHTAKQYPQDESNLLQRFRISNADQLPTIDRRLIVDRLASPSEYEFVCYRNS